MEYMYVKTFGTLCQSIPQKGSNNARLFITMYEYGHQKLQVPFLLASST